MAIRDRRDDLRSLYTPGSRKYWDLKTDSARVLYGALKANADDEGRLEGGVDDVKSLVPRAKWTLEEVESDLKDLARVGLISRYKAKGRAYIYIPGFVEIQHWHGVSREPSKYPCPPNLVTASTNNGFPVHQGPPLYSTEQNSNEKQREETEEENNVGGQDWSYKNFATRYSTLTGRHPGRAKKNVERYGILCLKLGEEKILAILGSWVESRGGKKRLRTNPFAVRDFLFTECEEMAGALSQEPEEPRGPIAPDISTLRPTSL